MSREWVITITLLAAFALVIMLAVPPWCLMLQKDDLYWVEKMEYSPLWDPPTPPYSGYGSKVAGIQIEVAQLLSGCAIPIIIVLACYLTRARSRKT